MYNKDRNLRVGFPFSLKIRSDRAENTNMKRP